MTSVIRRRAVVSGDVQGVGYRVWTRGEAQRHGLAGHVRNLPDGSVEVEVEGSEVAVIELIARLSVGPFGSRVENVEVSPLTPAATLGFSIRR